MTNTSFLLSQSQSELKFVAEFQQHSDLLSIRLKDFCARLGDLPEEASGELRLDLQHETRIGELESQRSLFEVALNLKAVLAGDTDRTLFELNCCIEAAYALAPNFRPSEEHLTSFRRANVLFHCWPYLRELVHNTTWRMGLMLPPLPLLRVVPEPEAKRTSSGRKAQKRPRRSEDSKG
jgi:preprotein translocase subunit SecB